MAAMGEDSGRELPPFTNIHGDCFDLDTCNQKFDKIYVAGGCQNAHRAFFVKMLRPKGVLIIPVDQGIEKVRLRVGGSLDIKLIRADRFKALEHPGPTDPRLTNDSGTLRVC